MGNIDRLSSLYKSISHKDRDYSMRESDADCGYFLLELEVRLRKLHRKQSMNFGNGLLQGQWRNNEETIVGGKVL